MTDLPADTLLTYVAQALAREAGSKAFREPGTAWQHAQDAWLAHANTAINAIERWNLRAKAPAPTALRDQYAAAIASYDHAVGLATDPAPRDHHHGQADAVLAVRDRELEQLRAEVERLKALIAESEAPGHAIRRAAVLNRIQVWADGPCPTRPKGFEITGDRALGYVQAMDEVAQLIAGHGPLALDPQEQS